MPPPRLPLLLRSLRAAALPIGEWAPAATTIAAAGGSFPLGRILKEKTAAEYRSGFSLARVSCLFFLIHVRGDAQGDDLVRIAHGAVIVRIAFLDLIDIF